MSAAVRPDLLPPWPTLKPKGVCLPQLMVEGLQPSRDLRSVTNHMRNLLI